MHQKTAIGVHIQERPLISSSPLFGLWEWSPAKKSHLYVWNSIAQTQNDHILFRDLLHPSNQNKPHQVSSFKRRHQQFQEYIKSHFLLEVHFYPFWISYHCRNNGRLFFRFLPRKYGASFFAKSCLRYDFVMVTIMPPTPNSKCQTISNNTWRFSLHIKWLVWPMWKCLK